MQDICLMYCDVQKTRKRPNIQRYRVKPTRDGLGEDFSHSSNFNAIK